MNARERRDAAIRREGVADAVVLLVAKRVVPTMTAHEWADRLGVSSLELQHAVARLQARVKPPPKARGGRSHRPADDLKPGEKGWMPADPQTCPTCSREFRDRRALAAHSRAVHTTAVCEHCGFVTTGAGIANHMKHNHPAGRGDAA